MSIADTIKGAVGLVSGVTSSAQSVLDYARPSATRSSGGGGTDPTAVIASNSPATADTGLRFPADISDYSMTITIKKYRRPSIFAKADIQEERHITLPLPAQLVDSFRLSWNDRENKGVLGYAGEKLVQAVGNAGQNESGELTAESVAKDAGGVIASSAAAGLISVAAGNPGGDLALQALGIAENKFMSVLFDKAEFKTHQFSWSLYPKTEAESATILKIINTLRDAALPGLAPGGIALTYPKMIQIRFYAGGKEAEFLYKFKAGVIADLSVNYTGDGGVPAFFSKTKAPVGVILSLSIKEIELWFNDAAANAVNLDSSSFVNATVGAATSFFDPAAASANTGGQ